MAFFMIVLGSTANGQVTTDAVTARRAQLEQQLSGLEKEISDQQTILDQKQKESVSLERDIAITNANIQKAKLNIQATNLAIQGLNDDISSKEHTITGLVNQLDMEKESLGQILRKTNEIDAFSIAEVVLSGTDVSKFFEDLDYFDQIKTSLQSSFTEVLTNKTQTETEKKSLEDKMVEQTDLKQIQVLEQKRLQDQEKQKEQILYVSKGVEKIYQQIIVSKQKDAAAIRTELFTLRGSAAIPFEKAYEYAIEASKKTGVRAALILGIIAEESNLGENVGTGSWKVDMASPRDTVPFKDICSRLGLDPDQMPVSKKPWYGYGGAMGPAQFIPSTWILYEDRIASAVGHKPPNPWDAQDAFMATALLIADNGGDVNTYAAERLSALRYLAGWKNATKSAYAFYGDDVMSLASKYQQQINVLQQS